MKYFLTKALHFLYNFNVSENGRVSRSGNMLYGVDGIAKDKLTNVLDSFAGENLLESFV